MKFFLLITTLIFVSAANADLSTKRTYKDAVDFIHGLAIKYPKTTQVFSMGFSDAGIAIEGVMIGNGPVHNLMVGAHHGNEYGSAELALNFAEAIAQSPIDGQTMFVIPVLNIDGFNNRNRYERVNGRNIDLNRDYPGPCGTEGPHFSKSSKALADFIDKNNIVASATIHSFWPAAVYPWGISTEDVETPYTSTFLKMVQTATETSHYSVGNSTNLIYPADGCYEDYAYWKHGIWSILFEVGNSHNPDLTDLNTLIKVNIPGMRKMFEMAPTVRAEKHDFTGQCSIAMKAMDLHIE